MGFFTGWLGPVTGEGKTSINGGADTTPIAIDWAIDAITSPRIRMLGTTIPRRVQFGGSVGFSYPEADPGSTTRDFVVYERIVNWEYADISIVEFIGNFNLAKDLWWRLPPGMSLWIGASYA